jgi:hypothetical protein
MHRALRGDLELCIHAGEHRHAILAQIDVGQLAREIALELGEQPARARRRGRLRRVAERPLRAAARCFSLIAPCSAIIAST